MTIRIVRVIAHHSQNSWLKIHPPLRWFPLFKCLRASQSPAWALSEHLGEGLAREPPGSWRPYGSRASPAVKASLHLLSPPCTAHWPFKAVYPLFCQITALPCSSALPHFPTQSRRILSSAFFVPFSLAMPPLSSFSALPCTWKSFSLSCLSV